MTRPQKSQLIQYYVVNRHFERKNWVGAKFLSTFIITVLGLGHLQLTILIDIDIVKNVVEAGGLTIFMQSLCSPSLSSPS